MLEAGIKERFENTAPMGVSLSKMEADVIFGDYNGTILDDVNTCVTALNVMLRRRNLAEIPLENIRRSSSSR